MPNENKSPILHLFRFAETNHAGGDFIHVGDSCLDSGGITEKWDGGLAEYRA